MEEPGIQLGDDQLQKIANFVQGTFKLKVSMDTYNGDSRQKCVVQDWAPFDYAAEDFLWEELSPDRLKGTGKGDEGKGKAKGVGAKGTGKSDGAKGKGKGKGDGPKGKGDATKGKGKGL